MRRLARSARLRPGDSADTGMGVNRAHECADTANSTMRTMINSGLPNHYVPTLSAAASDRIELNIGRAVLPRRIAKVLRVRLGTLSRWSREHDRRVQLHMLADLLCRILRAVLTEASLDDGTSQRRAVTSHEPVMLFDDILQAHLQREGEQRQRRSFVLDGEVCRVEKRRSSVVGVESKTAPCPSELGIIAVPDSLRAALFLSARLQCTRKESSRTSKPIAKTFLI